MSLQAIGLAVCLFLFVLCVIAVVSHAEGRRDRRKNIRVPRETLWERTNRYHEGQR